MLFIPSFNLHLSDNYMVWNTQVQWLCYFHWFMSLWEVKASYKEIIPGDILSPKSMVILSVYFQV